MSDVERLSEKENKKGGEGTTKANESSSLDGIVNEMQDKLVDIQGRINELGREMAKFATSPGLPHVFLQRPPPTRIAQPTIYPFLCHPRRTTTIMSALPNGRLHISLGLRSRRPRRALKPAGAGVTLAAPPQQPTCATSPSIGPTPRKRYTAR
jgi:hypothetical protein